MKILASNKKAFFDYEILEKLESGIVLTGAEVKSVKLGQISLKGAHVAISNNALTLIGCYINPYKFARNENYDPLRTRTLLVKKAEFSRLIGKKQEQGLTIVPLSVYTKRGFVKLEIAVAKGKKKHDKRDTIKKREQEREIARKTKNRYPIH